MTKPEPRRAGKEVRKPNWSFLSRCGETEESSQQSGKRRRACPRIRRMDANVEGALKTRRRERKPSRFRHTKSGRQSEEENRSRVARMK